MTPTSDSASVNGEIELLEAPALGMDADAILADFTHYFRRTLGRRTIRRDSPFTYQALVLAVRDRLMERWGRTRNARQSQRTRKVCYLSLEFLMGRLLHNALLNLDLEESAGGALAELGLDLEQIYDIEHDTGLGNGGLGRLAACFLDSCATLGYPVIGYGLRYHYGMFRQRIHNGHQVEEPDPWLRDGFPWEIERAELALPIKFGGRSEVYHDSDGSRRFRWVHTQDVLAVPFDIPIPGYRNDVVNTLRLWSAEATDAFNLQEFNAGSYSDAVASKNQAENITMVLYPNDASESGRELRLRQQYFLASASLQDVLRDWIKRNGSLDGFAENRCFQLNDTHPAVAVAELMRLLIDEHGLGWDKAWSMTTSMMAYTNHTLLPEALERWPVSLFKRLLPRVMEIIYEINARFLGEVGRRWPGDNLKIRQLSLIEEGGEPMVRMAHLAIVGSYSVNGVAELHSRLLREGLFRDFAELWPKKFNNKTNGVTHRRWLVAANPGLTGLISDAIGDGWISDLEQLSALREHAEEPAFQERWRAIRQGNKERLADVIAEKTGVKIDPAMLFDVQVKRIHEYKRQLLNLLHAIHLYDRIRRGNGKGMSPRAIIIGGKAAPGYAMA
ncbi:MAG: glycogen/starch/alpha-glucan family phosphorylase, partial [Xanthomonadales bacterium]|nr:glycogen/starch/alpha-glucan family phosphorylase [Xanthomonadales bacterium]